MPDVIDPDDRMDGYTDVPDASPVNASGAIDADGDGKPERLPDISYRPCFDRSESLLASPFFMRLC